MHWYWRGYGYCTNNDFHVLSVEELGLYEEEGKSTTLTGGS